MSATCAARRDTWGNYSQIEFISSLTEGHAGPHYWQLQTGKKP